MFNNENSIMLIGKDDGKIFPSLILLQKFNKLSSQILLNLLENIEENNFNRKETEIDFFLYEKENRNFIIEKIFQF